MFWDFWKFMPETKKIKLGANKKIACEEKWETERVFRK